MLILLQPFGNGKRACIGRPFAWQESLLVLAVVLQNFDIQLDDPSYQLKLKMALTVKPADLKIRVKTRDKLSATSVNQMLHGGGATNGHAKAESTLPSSNGTAQKPMTILFGSNTGTCQAFAQKAAATASARGFSAKVDDLDSGVDNLDQTGPLLIFTSSYEGEPPDNAAKFVEWLQTRKEADLEGVNYAVFGCGHRKSM
jgi:cytochrome P450 / NADPH-cytochrome P450 reductase